MLQTRDARWKKNLSIFVVFPEARICNKMGGVYKVVLSYPYSLAGPSQERAIQVV